MAWFKQTKIPCYILIFEQVDIIAKTLAFLARYSDRLDLIIIENPSENTPHIHEVIERYARQKIVKRHYLMKGNIAGNAFAIVLDHESISIGKQKFVLLTDGDITSSNQHWLDEELSIIQKNKRVFACGISLDQSNLPVNNFPEATGWIPLDKTEYPDYFEVNTGCHLLLMRGHELKDFLQWRRDNAKPFVDGILHAYCAEQLKKQWARTRQSTGYHLTWDLYADLDHPYTVFKLNKSFENTWYHTDTSTFTLVTY